jgi:acyl carrier protein
MSNEDTFQKVVAIIKPFAKNQEALAAVQSETKILEDLKVNSARLVDIVLEIENQFNVEMADEDVDQVHSVGDAVRIITSKMAA